MAILDETCCVYDSIEPCLSLGQSFLLGLHAKVGAWHAYRGYLVDTGQEFINSRELGKDSEAFEFDSGMGVLPEAIDMSGTVCLLQQAAASCQHQGICCEVL